MCVHSVKSVNTLYQFEILFNNRCNNYTNTNEETTFTIILPKTLQMKRPVELQAVGFYKFTQLVLILPAIFKFNFSFSPVSASLVSFYHI